MAQTPEGKVKAGIKALLARLDIWYFMPASGGFGKSGVPDFVCCWNGYFLGIEAKAPGKLGATSVMQKEQLMQIKDHGGLSLVCDDVSVLQCELTRFMESRK